MKQKMLIPALTLILGIAAGAIGGRMTAEPGDPGKQSLDDEARAISADWEHLEYRMCLHEAKQHLQGHPQEKVGDGSPEAWIAFSGFQLTTKEQRIECHAVVEGMRLLKN